MRISDWSSDVCSSDLSGEFGSCHARLCGRRIFLRFSDRPAFPNDSGVGAPLDLDIKLGDHNGFGLARQINADAQAQSAAIAASAAAHANADGCAAIPQRVAHRAAVIDAGDILGVCPRSAEHTSELQSLLRISYAVF